MLRDINQTEKQNKTKLCDLTYMWNLKKKKKNRTKDLMKNRSRINDKYREQTDGCQLGRG